MYVPSNKELEANISEKVYDSFAEMVFLVRSNSYEKRSCFKLVNRFDRIDKCSYGALLDFSYYCSNSSRYYKNEKAKELIKQVVTDIDRFINSYEYFLH
ncbi:hypothetical protein [Methanobrevibacter sp.]|uniref:hypothetical protein n=1 Tax=Methanobrevibacter sp. TaxID=66852 RepID=UPI00386494F9